MRERWSKPTVARCHYCGMVHSVTEGVVSPISPRMLPLGVGTRMSPWMLPWNRPLSAGMYECKFGELRVQLWWNGWCFTPGYNDKRCVSTRTLSSWRGTWE